TAFVFIITIASIIVRSDDKIIKTTILSNEAQSIFRLDENDFPLYNVYTKIYMNNDATIQLKNNVYAPKANELELGLRFSAKLFEDGVNAEPYYVLVDSNGNEYPLVNRERRVKNIVLSDIIKFQYIFERISFGSLYFDTSLNIINRGTESVDISAEAESLDSALDNLSDYISQPSEDDEKAGTSYYLKIYASKESTKPLFVTTIYNNNTPISDTVYKLPELE
ncbi:MAG: hypothetical protein RR057_06525, partial [Clostridia bacterium]